ncbi:hypothetical protein BOX15_Mlig033710g2 [Macrostomum lignano]|uniref:Uncharacterized protein n=2 Tax=Macrostomum lignano TaxID=282301 RepID=A0A267GBR5_9PLAT|nr:hypothetical protein BOX15_Mlig033710g1 [Macrostomum lignano]PAA82804.1 hypothetical protein BOX15_Mlig033710g2 [Macrostomum lignano]
MYNSGRDARDGDSVNAEKEIASRNVQVQAKRFYLDVKQNRRGRFLKIAEVGASGQKSRILMGMSTTTEFREKLDELIKYHKQTDSGATDGGDQQAFKFRSETIVRENRRYFLDLKENQRGKFLRIAQQVSPSGMRNQIAVPVQGLEDMRDRLVELMEECGTDDMAEGVERLPAPKSLRVDNKMFYFDVGANRRGMFLRLSEVRANFRTAVTVPEKSWASVRDILDEYIGKMAEENKEDAKEADEKEQ